MEQVRELAGLFRMYLLAFCLFVQDGIETELDISQSSPENPWPETERTEEELITCMPGESK